MSTSGTRRLRRNGHKFIKIAVDHTQMAENMDGFQRRSFESPSASITDCASHSEVAPSVYQLTIEKLTVDQFCVVHDDGFVRYGPVSHYFHRVRL